MVKTMAWDKGKQEPEEGEWGVWSRRPLSFPYKQVADNTVRQEKVRRSLPLIPTAQAGSPGMEKEIVMSQSGKMKEALCLQKCKLFSFVLCWEEKSYGGL